MKDNLEGILIGISGSKIFDRSLTVAETEHA
jgi:hypothetical protein